MKKDLKIIKAIKFCLYLVLFTPFVFGHSFLYPFISLKIFTFQALVEFIFALWLALIVFYKDYRPRMTIIKFALLIFMAVLLVSSVFGIDFHRSLWSTQARSIGYIGLLHFILLFFILSSLGKDLNWKKYFTVSFFISSIISLITIFSYLKLFGTDVYFLAQSSLRPGTFFGNPSFLAAYLLPHIFIGLWLLIENKSAPWRFLKLILLGLGVILNVIAVFLTETRGALIGLLSGLFFIFLYFAFKKYKENEIPVFGQRSKLVQNVSICLILLVFIFLLFFFLTGTSDFWQKIPNISRFTDFAKLKKDNEPRLIAWDTAWQSFLSRPILGYGFENYKYPFDYYYNPKLLRFYFSETYFDKPHNVLFEYLVNSGILGFLAYVGLFVFLIYELFKTKTLFVFKSFGFSLIIAYIIQNLFLFDTFGSYLMFFVIAAFIDSVYAQEKKPVLEKDIINAPKYLKPAVLVFLILLSLIPIYFVNYRSAYANNRQYWGLNYFLNRMPQDALDSYFLALTTPNPYLNEARKDFANNVSEIYTQGIEIPNIEKVSAKAMEEFVKAIQNSPKDYYLRVNFADLASVFYVFDKNYLKLAEEQINLAFKLSPNRQQNYYALARIKVIEGDIESARNYMEKAIVLDLKAGDPHFYYGLVLLQAGDRESGFKEIEKAKNLGRNPINSNEARLLANYYGEAGRYGEAIELYKSAASHNKDDLDALLKLGLVYFYSGDKADAYDVMKLFLEAKPDFRNSPNFSLIKPVVESLGL